MPECPWYDDDPDFTWVGIEVYIQPGQLEQDVCAIGCPQVCPGGSLTHVGVSGSRWLKGIADENVTNRLANGMIGDLLSVNRDLSSGEVVWNARRVPHSIHFHRAVCYIQRADPSNPAEECFDEDACDCEPPNIGVNEVDEFGNGYCDGVPANGIVPGKYNDRFFYKGSLWGGVHNQAGIWCRLATEHHSQKARVVSDPRMFTPEFFRSEDRRNAKPVGCSSNVFVPCIGTRPPSECEEDVSNVGAPYNPETYQSFSRVALLRTVGLRIPEGLPAGDTARLKVKNAILQELPNVAVDTLDQRSFVGPEQNNGLIDTWSGEFNADLSIPITDASLRRVPDVLGECRLAQTGCALDCELIIVAVRVSMKFVGHLITKAGVASQFDDTRKALYPHARIHVEMTVAPRAQLKHPDAGCQINETWWPADDPRHGRVTSIVVLNPEDEDYGTGAGHLAGFPRVAKAGEVGTADRMKWPDTIKYVDVDGVQFDPPERVEWWGMLGHSSNPPTEDVWDMGEDPQLGDLPTSCCKILKMLSVDDRGLTVPGWPTAISSKPNDPNDLYDGSFGLDFLSNWFGGGCHAYMNP